MRADPTALLTQIVNAAPISRCERGKASLKYIDGSGPIPSTCQTIAQGSEVVLDLTYRDRKVQ